MAAGETVPRHLLDSANRTIGKLQKQLDENTVESRREMEEATVALQNQLRVVQNQQRMAEDQLHRSMQRERDLRNQVSNADVSGIIGKLRGDLEATTTENKQLREQLEHAHLTIRENEDLKRKMSSMQDDLETNEATHITELRDAEDEIGKLRKALENADIQLAETMEAKDRELQEEIKDKESILRTQQAELQELHDALTDSHNILAATDQVSNQYSGRVKTLEMEISHVRTQMQEATKYAQDLERQCRALEEQIGSLEADLAAEQDLSARLTQSINAYETEVITIKGESASTNDELTKKTYNLVAEVEELQSKLAEAQADAKQAELDLKEAKDSFRTQMGDAEKETKHLRNLVREERDLLEKTMREHSAAMADQLETQQRMEHSALRREEALQRRLQQAEEEAEVLRNSSIPENQIKRLHESVQVEKEELQLRLDRTLEELRHAERALSMGRDEAQQQVQKAQHEMALANQQIQPLQLQLQEAMAECTKERRQRGALQEQVRLLTGAGDALQSGADSKLSKVAEVALRSLTEEHRRCVMDLALLGVDASRASALNTSVGAQQRTALGIVLRETTVEAVVPGSPADLSGKVFPRDELLLVDGSRVSAATAMAALRGDDAEGTVVTVVVRSAGSGETVEVKLFREGIARVREHQALAEEVRQLEEQAEQAGELGQGGVLQDRLRRLAEARRAAQRGQLEGLCRVGEWAQSLKESLESVVIKGRQAVIGVDACHQRVHGLQEGVEQELRGELGRAAGEAGAGPVDELHRTIQQLERAGRLQQEEMKGLQMLLKDAEERELKEVEARRAAEERARTVEEVQGELRRRVEATDAQAAEAIAEMAQFPAVVALRLGGVRLAKGREKEAQAALEQQLQAEVSVGLQAPTSAVQLLCSYGEEEVVALLKLGSLGPSLAAPTPAQRVGGRTGRMLAEELMAQVEDAGSVLRSQGLGKSVRGAQMHGPMSELTARSVRHALAARDREWQWVEQELAAVRGRAEQEQVGRSREAEEMAHETEARLAAARAAGREEGKAEAALEAEDRLREQGGRMREEWMAEVGAVKAREAQAGEEVAVLEESCRQKDQHVRALQGLLADLQGRLERVEEELHAAEDGQRHADHARARNAELALQMRQLIGPEVRACLTTLNNVESELGFFHAYQTRALSIAGCLGGLDEATGASAVTDAAQSKTMIDKDMTALREQLEQVLVLTARLGGSDAGGTSTLHSSRAASPPPGSLRSGRDAGEKPGAMWAGRLRSGGTVAAEEADGAGGWKQGGVLEGRSWASPGGQQLVQGAAFGVEGAGAARLMQTPVASSDEPPAKALPAVPSVGDVAGRFVVGGSAGGKGVGSPSREVRLSVSPPAHASASAVDALRLREEHGGGGDGMGPIPTPGSPNAVPRVLTPVARGKQPFGLRVAVLEVRDMAEAMAEHYLCGCVSVLPVWGEHESDARRERLLVPQHRTLPASGRGRVEWDGARQLTFSRSRILHYQHSAQDLDTDNAFVSGPKHVDYGPKDTRRRGVEVAATEELTGQAVLLLLTLHTAGSDVPSTGTVARCLVSVHRGLDAEKWYPLEGPSGGALQSEAGVASMLRMRIAYLPDARRASLGATIAPLSSSRPRAARPSLPDPAEEEGRVGAVRVEETAGDAGSPA